MFRTRLAAVLAILGLGVMSSGLVMVNTTSASATETHTLAWDGVNGADKLPCPTGIFWVFTGDSTTAPVFTVNGVSGTGEQEGNGAYHYVSAGATQASDVQASVTYTGVEGKNYKLTISHCDTAPVTQVGIPSDPTPVAPTCTADGSFTLPADTDAIDWSISPAYAGPGSYTVTAATKPGFAFTDGTTSKTYAVTVLPKTTGQQCTTKPADQTETRDVDGTPDCTAMTVTTEHQSRTLTYTWDGSKYVGTWSDWKTVSTDTREATDQECPGSVPDGYRFCHQEGNGVYNLSVAATAAGLYNGHYTQHEGDIIPPFTYRGQTYSLNWTPGGQVIFGHGCTVMPTKDSTTDYRTSCEKGVESQTTDYAYTWENGAWVVHATVGPWTFVRNLNQDEAAQCVKAPTTQKVSETEDSCDIGGYHTREGVVTTTYTYNPETKGYDATVATVWGEYGAVTPYDRTEQIQHGCIKQTDVPDDLSAGAPTCLTDGSFTLPSSEDYPHVLWTVSDGESDVTSAGPTYGVGTYHVTATAAEGYYFGKGAATQEYDVTVLPKSDTSANCVGIPTNNTPTEASCASGGSYTLPADGEHYRWEVEDTTIPQDRTFGPGTYTVDAIADEGWHFADDTTIKSWTVTVPEQVTGPSCYTVVEVPASPSVTQPDCATDGSLNLPAASSGVVWVVNDKNVGSNAQSFGPGSYTVVAQAVEGHKFFDESTSKSFGSYSVGSATGDCPVFATAAAPSVSQSEACGVQGSYTVPTTAGVQYLLDGSPVAAGEHPGPASGTITAAPSGNVILTNPEFSFTLDLPAAADCPVPPTVVTPAAPTFTNPSCDNPNGAAAIYEDTDAVDYSQTGTVAQGGDVTVTAVPKDGYAFPEGFVASWSHHFTGAIVCGTETVKPRPHNHHHHVSHHPSRQPTVLGTEAVAVPTAVDAGLAGAAQGSVSQGHLLAELLVGGGMLLLLAGGWLGLGRRPRGSHQL